MSETQRGEVSGMKGYLPQRASEVSRRMTEMGFDVQEASEDLEAGIGEEGR